VDDDGHADLNREFFAPNTARSSRIAGVKNFQYEPGKTVLENLQVSKKEDKGELGLGLVSSEEEELLMVMEYHNSKLFGPIAEEKKEQEAVLVKKPASAKPIKPAPDGFISIFMEFDEFISCVFNVFILFFRFFYYFFTINI